MTNDKSTAKTKDEMRWAMVRPELEAVLEEMWLARGVAGAAGADDTHFGGHDQPHYQPEDEGRLAQYGADVCRGAAAVSCQQLSAGARGIWISPGKYGRSLVCLCADVQIC